ncbi:MAG: D-2-hydroxyacid dehydrogenase [Syntrophomonadaceae bacterium]|nr:D-2-hydroxyacid dehydrogenase [Syntrophomonadaceae bacterium]
MKIVVLDGYTLNPGDLSWDGLREFGDVTVYDRTPEELVISRSQGAEILLTNKTILDKEKIAQLPALCYVGVLATGYIVIDLQAARLRNITVTNIPAYSTRTVAQMTFALLLELCDHVQEHSNAVRKGRWSQSIDFCYWDFPIVELDQKNMGIIGMGKIGRQVTEIAAAFGMKVLAYDIGCHQETAAAVEWVEMPELLAQSDVVSLHCPLTPENKGMVNLAFLAQMKPSAFLINTSRGPLVAEQDLADALNSGVIAGAGLDVLAEEPPPQDNPLLTAKNCLITPHIAWAAREARTRLMKIAVDNLSSFLKGNPVNQVF